MCPSCITNRQNDLDHSFPPWTWTPRSCLIVSVTLVDHSIHREKAIWSMTKTTLNVKIAFQWVDCRPPQQSPPFISQTASLWISHCLSQDQRIIVLLLILSHNQYTVCPSLRNSYNPENMYTRILNATLLLFMTSAEASKVNIIVWVPPESRTTGWGLRRLSFIRSWSEEKASEAGKEKAHTRICDGAGQCWI